MHVIEMGLLALLFEVAVCYTSSAVSSNRQDRAAEGPDPVPEITLANIRLAAAKLPGGNMVRALSHLRAGDAHAKSTYDRIAAIQRGMKRREAIELLRFEPLSNVHTNRQGVEMWAYVVHLGSGRESFFVFLYEGKVEWVFVPE
jgi:hypothetical protein